MEDDLKIYFKGHASNFGDDNAIRVSDTKEYFEKIKKEGKEEKSFLAKKVGDRMYYEDFALKARAPTYGKKQEDSSMMTLQVDVHQPEQPEVVISSMMEICKMATIVRPSSAIPDRPPNKPSSLTNISHKNVVKMHQSPVKNQNGNPSHSVMFDIEESNEKISIASSTDQHLTFDFSSLENERLDFSEIPPDQNNFLELQSFSNPLPSPPGYNESLQMDLNNEVVTIV